MSRTFVVGDVHGCSSEFNKLLSQLQLTPEDHFIFIGDLLHKGPYSDCVLLQADAIGSYCRRTIVCGNHEEKQIRFMKTEDRLAGSTKKNPMQHTEGYLNISKFMEDNHDLGLREALDEAPFYVQTEGFTLVHGGIAPRANLYDLTCKTYHNLRGEEKEKGRWLLFTRYVSPLGYPVALGQEAPEDKFWAEIYDGRYGHVIFGHHPFLEPTVKHFPHATGIDLGCVYGNQLAAVEIKDGEIVREYYQQADRQYQLPHIED